MDVSPAVTNAVAELRLDHDVVVIEPDGEGGAYVTVEDVDLGPQWEPQRIDLSFHLPFNYPFAAVYPFYGPSDLRRADSGECPPVIQRVEWRGRPVAQISLRASRWQPQIDTASGAVAQVRYWFKDVA
jgi:hypothetical protein